MEGWMRGCFYSVRERACQKPMGHCIELGKDKVGEKGLCYLQFHSKIHRHMEVLP